MALIVLASTALSAAALVPTTPAKPPFVSKIAAAAVIGAEGKTVDITFVDGSAFRFHSLWLRDACRDDEHVAGHAGERYLTATPVGPSGVRPDLLGAKEATVGSDGSLLHISWTDASFGDHEMAADPPRASTFPSEFLRTYASSAAECLAQPTVKEAKAPAPTANGEFTFLAPYSGFPGARAPAADEISLWRADELEVPVFQHDEVLDPTSNANLRAIQAMLRVGCIAIDGCDDPGEVALRRLADNAFGGLQKDPTRDIANWKIVKKDGATSVSYDHLKRLNQHTDSSIPPHGLPALCLLMHYAEGTGTNTFTDGFAVAHQLASEDPEGYALLTRYGYDAERDFVASRVDSPQQYNRGLIVSTQQPLLQLDDRGALQRIQYNEVFRTPLTLPYDVFPKWYAAFARFVELVHSDEFERKVPMHKGRLFLMNNWRVLCVPPEDVNLHPSLTQAV